MTCETPSVSGAPVAPAPSLPSLPSLRSIPSLLPLSLYASLAPVETGALASLLVETGAKAPLAVEAGVLAPRAVDTGAPAPRPGAGGGVQGVASHPVPLDAMGKRRRNPRPPPRVPPKAPPVPPTPSPSPASPASPSAVPAASGGRGPAGGESSSPGPQVPAAAARLDQPWVLVPRDGLFCKDGRGWYSSSLGRGYGLAWPMPSTLHGALRTACGRAFEQEQGATLYREAWLSFTAPIALGASLALARPVGGTAWTQEHRVWPVPADAWFGEGATAPLRLDPQPPERGVFTLGRALGSGPDQAALEAAREALWRPVLASKAKPARGRPPWWDEAAMTAWLGGRATDAASIGPDEKRAKPLKLVKRLQVRLAIDGETLTGRDGRLFSTEILETLDRAHREWAIGCRLEDTRGAAEPPHPAPLAPVTLGSERMLADLQPADASLFGFPESRLGEVFDRGSVGVRLIAVTPLIFDRPDTDQGWLPTGFTEEAGGFYGELPGLEGRFQLLAAFMPRPMAVSGWDMVGGHPKRGDRAVPPGAVFFLRRQNRQPLTGAELRTLWLAALGCRTEEGFGRVLPAIWTPVDR